MPDPRPTLADALASRAADASTTPKPGQAEMRKAWGRAMTADVRRDAELLREQPRNWELLYREGVAFTQKEQPEDGTKPEQTGAQTQGIRTQAG